MSDSTPQIHLERLRELAMSRQRVTLLPTEKIVDAILDHPQPTALVHSFSEIDLHLLVRDIGPEDALPLVQLASNRQWEYFLDAEIWDRDQIDYPMATLWLGLLCEADPVRLARWCMNDQLEFLELYLFRNIDARIREFDQPPSELGEDYFTDDDTFYVRLVDAPVHMPADAAQKDRRDAMLVELLQRISAMDHFQYQGLLMESMAVIPAEMEESLFRLRNVRLAEKGLLPFHEAIGVFQPLRPEDLRRRGKKRIHPPLSGVSDLPLPPVPTMAASFLEADTRFVRALKYITDDHVLGQLRMEVASLCNQVIVANQQKIQDRRQLAGMVGTVNHYLGIGIERMLADASLADDAAAANLLRRHFLVDLFRVGYASVLDLRRRAMRWQRGSQFRTMGLKLHFWDESGVGVLGGLLIERPKCYDPTLAGTLYRDFHTLAEIEAAQKTLDQIIWMDHRLPRFSIPVPFVKDSGFFTYKTLLLTAWARHRLKMEPGDALSIPISVFRPFYQELWIEEQGRRIIDASRRADFSDWLAGIGDDDPALADRPELRKTLVDAICDEVEAELAKVLPENLDPRYIRLFLLT